MTEESLLVHTISRIRTIVLVTISIFVIYHSVLHIDSRRDSCRWLLQHGRLVAGDKWQPFGCLLHGYNKTDSKLCLRRASSITDSPTNLVFIGDTRILQLYHHILERFFSKVDFVPVNHNYSFIDKSQQHDLYYRDEELGLNMEFRWRPKPTPQTFDDIRQVLYPDRISNGEADTLKETTPMRVSNNFSSVHDRYHQLNPVSTLIVVGYSPWVNVNQDYDFTAEQFKTNMTRLLTRLKGLKPPEKETKILWSLQDPIVESKLPISFNVTNKFIDNLNTISEGLIDTLSIKDIILLTSHRRIAKSLIKLVNNDGIHGPDIVVEYKSQIILNFLCNRIYRYDSTCCSENQAMNFIQLLFISLASVVIIAYIIYLIRPQLFRKKHRTSCVKWQKVPLHDNILDEVSQEDDVDIVETVMDQSDLILLSGNCSQKDHQYIVSEELLINIAKFCLTIIFMFICDRTNFFMKENKYFTLANFILPLLYMFALGMFFTEAQPDGMYTRAGTMLSRSQTDEWKGWMQLVVLIYNLSSAENNLRIYMIIRVLLSSYLFLTGYGHFTYFYKTGDISLRRLCQVILRLNLLVVCLCLCMNRPYQYYYFVPLVSFWFVVVFLFMKIKPIKNPDRPNANDHFWIIFKLTILLGLITMLYVSEVFFEKLFIMSPWRFLFTSGPDKSSIKDWWHHWSVDRYSCLAGMIYGLFHWTIVAPFMGIHDAGIGTRTPACHSRESSLGSADELVFPNPVVTLQALIKLNSSYFITLALIGLSFYSIFAATCSDKASCDEIHAYVSFVPIICYIILRNANIFLRNRHSILFAFIGRISLSLSVCQYHIWLAAGQRGILVLVPSNPTLNLVVTSIIFITTSHKLNLINSAICRFAIWREDP